MNLKPDLYKRGCVVSVTVRDEERSLSGILVDTKNGLVLTHGTIISSVLSEKQTKLLSNRGILQNCFESWHSHVILENSNTQVSSKKIKSVLNSSDIGRTLQNGIHTKYHSFSKFSASVVSIFIVNKLNQVIFKLLSPNEKWKFIEDLSLKEIPDDLKRTQILLSSFILIKLDEWQSYENYLPFLEYDQVSKGDSLEVEATPFADLNPKIFLNNRSNGIVSNKAGGILLMTDARCVPGSDGGPVFCRKDTRRYLIGMVITSLCWKNNEWVGLSLVCAIPEVLKSVEHICRIEGSHRKQIIQVTRNRFSDLTAAVPMVIVGSNWGSGVVIGQKGKIFLLTCSHVVKGSDYNTVRVKFQGNLIGKGNVLFKTSLDGPFDVALLTISHNTGPHIPIASQPVMEGDKVFVVGHALFGEEKNLEASITSGTVSKVVTVNGVPVMLQTTCAVHAGASGGAVVNQTGELVGIAVSNAKDMASKALYPHINMSVPIVTVADYLQQYMASQDISVLKNLTVRNKEVKRLWTLEQTQKASKL